MAGFDLSALGAGWNQALNAARSPAGATAPPPATVRSSLGLGETAQVLGAAEPQAFTGALPTLGNTAVETAFVPEAIAYADAPVADLGAAVREVAAQPQAQRSSRLWGDASQGNPFARLAMAGKPAGELPAVGGAGAALEGAVEGAARQPNVFERALMGARSTSQADVFGVLNLGRGAPEANPIIERAAARLGSAASEGGGLLERLLGVARSAAPIVKR